MTRLTVPPADADGYWHYTYVTYHPDTFEWYGGKHTTKNLDDGYLGSGNWVVTHPTRNELVMEVVEFFNSEEHAYAAEAAMIAAAVMDDALCRNAMDGGRGMSAKRAAELRALPQWRENTRKVYTDPKWLERIRAARSRQASDPEWLRKVREGVAKRVADPKWRQKNLQTLARLWADPAYRAKVSEAASKLSNNPEWKKKNREVGAKNKANPEWQKNLRAALAKRDTDPEFQWKIRQAAAKRTANPELQRKLREEWAERTSDPEFWRKNREGIARRSADPEWRAKCKEAAVRREINKSAEEWVSLFMWLYEQPEVQIAGAEKLAAGD